MGIARVCLRTAFGAALLLAMGVPAVAGACRQALAMGLDVSGSVDAEDYRLQMDGLAAALTDPQVKTVLLAGPRTPVELMVYEWSGPMHQEVVADWTAITDETALENFTAKLTGRRRRPASPSTALGTALLTGARMLATRRDCAKKTLDISGDGLSNTGPRPQDLGARAELEGVVVNALAVGHGDAEGRATAEQLKAYFERAVIRGPRAFAEPAVDYAAYSEAMRRKLLRELEGAVVSDARP